MGMGKLKARKWCDEATQKKKKHLSIEAYYQRHRGKYWYYRDRFASYVTGLNGMWTEEAVMLYLDSMTGYIDKPLWMKLQSNV